MAISNSEAVQTRIIMREHWHRQQPSASWEKIRLAVRHQIESRKADRIARVYLAHENWSSEARDRVKEWDMRRVQPGDYKTAKAPSHNTWFHGFDDLLVSALRNPITQWKNRLHDIENNNFISKIGSSLYYDVDEAVDKHFFDLAVARELAFREKHIEVPL